MARRRWNLETIEQIMSGDNPFIQVGYSVPDKIRKEGEEWTDIKGITWRQLKGAKVTVNKQMDFIRSMLKRICSGCGQDIDLSCDKLDHKVFPKTGKCYNCLETDEFVLRATGKWVSYEKMKILKNKKEVLKDFKEKVIESIDFLKNDTGKMGEIMDNGELMTWTGKSNPQWLIDAEADLIKVNNELQKIEKEIFDFENELKK